VRQAGVRLRLSLVRHCTVWRVRGPAAWVHWGEGLGLVQSLTFYPTPNAMGGGYLSTANSRGVRARQPHLHGRN
jgi:hypothetical protein